MIVYNGPQSSVLAGRQTGVLDNCFTVGWAGERGGSTEGRSESKGKKERKGWREGTSELEIERELGKGSLEFVAHRISSSSLSFSTPFSSLAFLLPPSLSLPKLPSLGVLL